MESEYTLPPLYDPWAKQLLGGPIPAETKATCDDCAMLPKPGDPPGAVYFEPIPKCCTYEPNVPNFLTGRILADDDPDIAEGKATVEKRIARRVDISPWGMHRSAKFELIYINTPHAFGRAPALRCPHYLDREKATCGIWSHRPGVCSTWFCKHTRGATGAAFWRNLADLLRVVEIELGLWCAMELGAGSAALLQMIGDRQRKLDLAELEGPLDVALYRALWGEWLGRESEFYRQSARLVESLSWSQIEDLSGPRVRMMARITRQSHERLTSEAIPSRLRLNQFNLAGMSSGKYSLTTYSGYDPLTMTHQLASVLPFFHGQPTAEALESIHDKLGLRLAPALLRRMIDFEILVAY